MRHSVKIAILGLVLIVPSTATIAASKSPKLARCDGKQRRAANPYGSILPTIDPASGTVSPASATPPSVDVFPQNDPAKSNRRDPPRPSGKALPQIPPIGALTPRTTFGSC